MSRGQRWLRLAVLCGILALGLASVNRGPPPLDPEQMAECLKSNSALGETGGLDLGHDFWVDQKRSRKTTVKARLRELRASLRYGKVVDAREDELYFYFVSDYHHRASIRPRQNTEQDIAELEKEYRVIRMYGPASKE